MKTSYYWGLCGVAWIAPHVPVEFGSIVGCIMTVGSLIWAFVESRE